MKSIKLTGLILLVAMSGGLLGGCSSDSGGAAPASYDGVSTQAGLTANNSQDFADASLDGASPSAGLVANANGDSADSNAHMLGFIKQVAKLTDTLHQEKENGNYTSAHAAVVTESNTENSPCGGSMSFTISIDDQTFEWSGSISFNNFKDCELGSTMNGGLAFEGDVNLTTYTFTSMSYADASEAFTLTGTMKMNGIPGLNSGSFTITMDMDFRDDNANKTYRMSNMVMTLSEGVSTYTMNIAGRVYHPDHGYTDITTDAGNLITGPNDGDYPTSGIMYLAGSNNSKTTVTFNSDGTYTLDIDTNGDTVNDTGRQCTWSTGECTVTY